MKRLMLTVLASVCLLLVVLGAANGQHHGQVSSSGYTYSSQTGYWHYGQQAYTRAYVQSAGYWNCGVYYPGAAYYQYYPVANYQAQAAYTPPASYDDYKALILKIAADREKHQQFMELVRALKLDAPAYPGGYQPMSYPNAYGYQGHYYHYSIPTNANTQYGYTYNQVAALYGSTDLNLLYQQAAQLAAGSQRLTSDATAGFQQLVGQAGENAVRIAEIQAKGLVAAAVIKAMESAPAAQYKGYSFKIGPGGQVEKMENNVDPNTKLDIQKQLAALVGTRCASCHTGATPKGGFDVAGYLQMTKEQKEMVWDRLTTQDQKRIMPRNADGTAGKRLTPEEFRLFLLN